MIVVVDYGRGNLFSLSQAIRVLGYDHIVTDQPAKLLSATKVLLPGVGAFGDAMQGLQTRGLASPLQEVAQRGTPFLGICVGCQVLLSKGEEFGEHDGLNLIPGRVVRLPNPAHGDRQAIRIPNVGWRSIHPRCSHFMVGTSPVPVYFVHSYAPVVGDPAHVVATIPVNGQDIHVAVQRGNVLGVQFHPEKSGREGLEMLRNFLDWNGR